MIANIVKAGLT